MKTGMSCLLCHVNALKICNTPHHDKVDMTPGCVTYGLHVCLWGLHMLHKGYRSVTYEVIHTCMGRVHMKRVEIIF